MMDEYLVSFSFYILGSFLDFAEGMIEEDRRTFPLGESWKPQGIGFRFQVGMVIFLFLTAPRLSMERTQLPIQRMLG